MHSGQDRPTIKVFVSSPGDVFAERTIARRVLERLRDQYAREVTIEPYLWEYEPLPATRPFSESIPRTSEMDIVCCILWSRLGTPIDKPEVHDSGTEFEFVDAWRAHERTKGQRPVLLVYRKTAQPMYRGTSDTDRHEFEAQLTRLREFERKWLDEEDGRPKVASWKFETNGEFQSQLSSHLGKLVEARAHGTRMRRWTGGSPYKGLNAFQSSDAPIYFGRDADVHRLLEKMAAQPQPESGSSRDFALIIGRSGSGKSSLAQAGLLGRLLEERHVMRGVEHWRHAVVQPGDRAKKGDAFDMLAAALANEFAVPEVRDIPDLATWLREDPSNAVRYVCNSMIAGRAGTGVQTEANHARTRLAIIVDQLEELWHPEVTRAGETVDAEAHRKRMGAFIHALNAFSRCGYAWVVATLRSDYYDSFMQIPEFGPLMEGAVEYKLDPPMLSEVRQIILRPAAAVGIRITEPLETELDQQVRGNPDCLPLLEYLLDQLYSRARESSVSEMTLADYGALGGLDNVVSGAAEKAFSKLSQEARDTLPRVARELVRISPTDNKVARQPAALSQFKSTPPALELVQAFASARLFTLGTTSVEITHERLLDTWQPLREILSKEEDLIRIRTRIEAAFGEWDKGEQRKEFLIREGQQLTEAIHALKAGFLESHLKLKDYVTKSRQFSQRNRKIRRSAIWLGFILVISLVLVGIFFRFERIGHRETLLTNTRLLQDQSLDQERLGDSGMSAVLLGHALKQSAGLGGGHEEALRVSLTLAQSRLLPLHQIVLIPGEVRCCPVSSDGRRCVVGSADGYVRLIDLETGAETARYLTGKEDKLDAITDISWDHANSRIAVATVSGAIHLLEIVGPPDGTDSKTQPDIKLLRVIAHRGQPLTVRFDSHGRQLLVAGRLRDKSLHPDPDYLATYDAASGERLQRLPVDFDLYAADFSADDRSIAAGGGDGSEHPPRPQLLIFDAQNMNASPRTLPQPSRVFTVSFHPLNPNLLVTGDVNGSVRFWNLKMPPSKEADGPDIRHEKQVRVTEYSDDGNWILVGGEDGAARLWDVESRAPLSQRLDHRNQVRGGAVSLKSNRLITADYTDGIHVWDLIPRSPPAQVLRHPSPVWDASFDETGEHVITGCASNLDRNEFIKGAARVWKVNGGAPVVLQHGADVMAARFRPGAKEAATCGNDGSVKVWNTVTGNLLFKSDVPAPVIMFSAAFNQEGTTLACGGFEKNIRIFNFSAETGSFQEATPLKKPNVYSFVWKLQMQGNRLMGDGGGSVRIWNSAGSPETFDDFPRQKGAEKENTQRTKIEYWLSGTDGKSHILTIGSDGEALIWNIYAPESPPVRLDHLPRTMGRPVADWHGPTEAIATGGADGVVRVWRLSDGKWAMKWELRHTSAPEIIHFSPDGKWLATGCRDGGVRLWSAQTGVWTGAGWYHTGPVTRLEFSRKGTHILSASRDRTARIVSLPAPATGDATDLLAQLEADAGIVVDVDATGSTPNVAAPRPISREELDARRNLRVPLSEERVGQSLPQ